MAIDSIARGLAAGAQQRLDSGWKLRDLYDLTLRPIPDVMSSPPTITRGTSNANSTIQSGATTTTATIPPESSKLTWNHGTAAARTVYPTNYWDANTINYGGGTLESNFISISWMSDAPEWDMALREGGGQHLLWVDGQPMTRGVATSLPNTGDLTYHKVSFGADALSYAAVNATLSVASGGSGYAIGDTITWAGGTFSSAAVYAVASVNAGAVTGLRLVSGGNYSVVPTGTISQGSTSGSGTGCTVAASSMTWGQIHTTRKFRRYELFLYNVSFGGINVPSGCTVLPWSPAVGEPWLFAGDSILEGSWTTCPASTYGPIAAQALGCFGGMISYGIGSVGWLQTAGSRPNFLQQVPDLITLCRAKSITRMVIGLGINDVPLVAADVQANVASALSQLAAALPDCVFFVLGPWTSRTLNANTATISAAISAGVTASLPASRGTFIDVVADGLLSPDGTAATSPPGTGNTGHWTSSDNVHPSPSGHLDNLGPGVANGIWRGAKRIVSAAMAA